MACAACTNMRPSWPPPMTPSRHGLVRPGRQAARQKRGALVHSWERHARGRFGLVRRERRPASGAGRGRRLASMATANKRRVGRAGCANGEGGHRHALGHLHDAVQRIHARQVLARHRHAQHRHHRLGRQHARQVRRAAGAGDDGLQAAARGRFGVGKHVVGHAVRRHHARLVRDTKVLQDLHRVLHGVPVGAGAHDHADLNGVH